MVCCWSPWSPAAGGGGEKIREDPGYKMKVPEPKHSVPCLHCRGDHPEFSCPSIGTRDRGELWLDAQDMLAEMAVDDADTDDGEYHG